MGRLTTHVLDIAAGRPAPGMRIRLTALDSGTVLGEFTTNADGRLPGLPALVPGAYRLTFAVADYFRSRGVALPNPPFLDRVTIDFGVAEADGHYHVPLVMTPWSYATYRGS